MIEKKSILLLASATALTLALPQSALSSPPTDEPPPPTAAQQATPEATAPAAAEGSSLEKLLSAPAAPGAPVPPKPPAHAAVPTPPEPPESPVMDRIGSEQARTMTPEERNALREKRFQKMRKRFTKRRQEMTERWDSYWKILDAMTPEQKEAIEAIFGSRRSLCSHHGIGHPMPSEMPMQPPRPPRPRYGFPSSSSFPGLDYGYGPRGAQPYPYESGPSTSWPGDWPMYPGADQPWPAMDEGSFRGPPPPGGDYTKP
jgi:hypothetical protein